MYDQVGQTTAALGIALQVGDPVLLWGEPGTGKSAVIQSVCKVLKRPVEVVIGSIRDATDIGGIPFRTATGVRLAPPEWAVRSAADGEAVVLFDELTTSAAEVQAAMLSVILERRVGDLTLPSTVSFVAAANPAGSGGFRPLSVPLANRFCHLDWVTDVRGWASALRSGWPLPTIPMVPVERRQANEVWRDRIAAFICRRPELLQSGPDEERSRAWASQRSWTMAARLASAADAAGASRDVLFLLISGCVGEGRAVEFLAFVADSDLVDPESALDDPWNVAIPERADRCHALLHSVAGALGSHPSEERWRSAWTLVTRVATSRGLDVALVAGRQLAAKRDPSWEAPESADMFEPLLDRIGQ